MKKSERLPIIKQKMAELKNTLREQLSKLKVSSFEFDINGNTIEARLYDTGIREVLEKLTQEKAGMLSLSKEIFENSEYLYSTQDKSGDTNIEAWDYFYVPIKIGDETAGVRIAIRKPVSSKESQIYNWSIKKDTSLGGVRHTPFGSNPNGTSSDVSVKTIPQNGNAVNTSDTKSVRNAESKVTLNVEKSTEEDGYTYDNISIMLDGKEVGTIGMVVDENEPYLERIDIDEEYRNKGIGTDALRLVAEKYGEFLIAPDNEDAKRLYERYGDESSSDNAAYIDQGYGVYSIYSVPESKGYTARAKAEAEQQSVQDAAQTQQSSENAAQTQRAETEEEARLRTLYESEPEGTEDAAKTSREAPGTVSFEQMYGTKPPDGTENQSFEEWAARKDAEKKKAAEKKATLAEKQKNADSRNIRTDMTDDERYEALKNEKIKIEPYNSEKLKGENAERLNATTSKEARRYIKTLAEKFEVFKKYVSEKAKVEFRFSKNNLAESASKQGKIKTEYAEMLSAADAVIQNAVLVEAHKDKYAGTTREDKTLLQTDVLLSAFADENGIVPVRLTVKEYRDKDNSLYALITLEKIETEVSGRGESSKTTPEPYPVSEMSIPDIVSKIKPTDGKILKYLPDKLLSAEQLEGKRAALAKDKKRIEGLSQKGDFAAKAQQAETEEEARLRTLYESEPENGQKEAGAGEGETDKTDKFIEDTQKRIEDAKITDGKLKEMPEDKQKEVLKDRAERAGLDMDAEELVDFAQSLGRIKGLFGSEFKDFARILDDVSGRSLAIRNTLHKLFERPFRQAQSQYTQNYKRAVEHISKKFSELGIKAGSKESAAVQRYGEGVYQVSKNGETKPYTEEMLKRDFPESWEKIEEAAKYSRTVYDYYLKNLNEMYEKIYPNTLEKAEVYKNKVREKSVREFKKAGQLGKYARGLETNLMCGLF